MEKAFLYDVVANSNDSIDVDKFEYIVRDSFCAGIPVPFNKAGFLHLFSGFFCVSFPGHPELIG